HPTAWPDTCSCRISSQPVRRGRGPAHGLRLGRAAREPCSGKESAMRAATHQGAAVLAAFLALAGPRAAPASTPDAWITTRAKMALLATEGLRGETINVDTVNGRITLHGRVRTADEKTKAEDAVRTVDGVKDVRNILQVVGGHRER